MLNYLSEETPLAIVFLDNLINHFSSNSSNYYINLEELKELFDISCESLEANENIEEFMNMIIRLKNIGILSPSNKGIDFTYEIVLESELSKNFYFLLLNPIKLKAMVDAVFTHRAIF
jgi:hypothetical protein